MTTLTVKGNAGQLYRKFLRELGREPTEDELNVFWESIISDCEETTEDICVPNSIQDICGRVRASGCELTPDMVKVLQSAYGAVVSAFPIGPANGGTVETSRTSAEKRAVSDENSRTSVPKRVSGWSMFLRDHLEKKEDPEVQEIMAQLDPDSMYLQLHAIFNLWQLLSDGEVDEWNQKANRVNRYMDSDVRCAGPSVKKAYMIFYAQRRDELRRTEIDPKDIQERIVKEWWNMTSEQKKEWQE